MVYDEEASELISLEEFKKRTLYRFVGITGRDSEPPAAAEVSVSSNKRKAENGEGKERNEKKAKLDTDMDVDVDSLEEGETL